MKFKKIIVIFLSIMLCTSASYAVYASDTNDNMNSEPKQITVFIETEEGDLISNFEVHTTDINIAKNITVNEIKKYMDIDTNDSEISPYGTFCCTPDYKLETVKVIYHITFANYCLVEEYDVTLCTKRGAVWSEVLTNSYTHGVH